MILGRLFTATLLGAYALSAPARAPPTGSPVGAVRAGKFQDTDVAFAGGGARFNESGPSKANATESDAPPTRDAAAAREFPQNAAAGDLGALSGAGPADLLRVASEDEVVRARAANFSGVIFPAYRRGPAEGPDSTA